MTADRRPEPLWTCPSCGRTFANPRQTHTCAALRTLDDHFTKSDPQVRATFDAILSAVRRIGPVDVLPERTRIAFHVRMSFAAFTPRQQWLNGHLVLARGVNSPRFVRVQTFSPHNVLHAFRLSDPAEIDAEFTDWLREAYLVGEQRHHRPPD
jgi:hypothetical protein